MIYHGKVIPSKLDLLDQVKILGTAEHAHCCRQDNQLQLIYVLCDEIEVPGTLSKLPYIAINHFDLLMILIFFTLFLLFLFFLVLSVFFLGYLLLLNSHLLQDIPDANECFEEVRYEVII